MTEAKVLTARHLSDLVKAADQGLLKGKWSDREWMSICMAIVAARDTLASMTVEVTE